ncbi:MAG TPA: acetylornithine/succinylornithine family transaminase [Ignavibacteriaceae bacterium]|nr:acetylornithine/succinylornithine family transaminase [Ignavibacteriaceae bacterium]
MEKEKQLFFHTYNRIPLEISRAEGVHLIDKNDNRYLDLFSGLAVNALGYSHPKIISAVMQQMTKFSHLSNGYISDIQLELAELLISHTRMSKAFFTNSGTEAIEGTIKLIRKKFGPDKKIYSLNNSFHGRTYGALSLTNRAKYQKGFEPFLPNIDKIGFNNVEDLKNKIDSNTAAVFIEFIQGEGGVNIVSNDFIEELKKLRKKYEFAIVADEIQTGIGRTGKKFGFSDFDISPDIIVLAKALGGGLPLGAFLATSKFDDIFKAGNHGTTFGGNPVCCAAGKVVLTEVFENGLMEHVKIEGEYLISQLNELAKLFPEKISKIRGKGFMVGIELLEPGMPYVSKMRERRVLINCTNSNVIRLLPPLIISKNDIDFFLFNLHELLKV